MEQVPSIGDALNRWLAFLELRGKPATTRRTYRSLLATLRDSPDPLADLDTPRLHALVLDRYRSNSPATTATMWAALSSFLTYCREQHWTTQTMQGIPRPIVPVKAHRYLSKDEIGRILAAAFDHERTMILLLLTGLRVAELCSIRWQDYDAERGEIRVLFTKGNKPRTIAAGRALRAALDAEPHADARIIALTTEGVRIRLRQLGKRARVPGLHPHLFRHTFATWFLIEGGIESKGALKALGGWSKDEMLEHYTRSVLGAAAIKRAHELDLTDRLLGD